jgi:hypothetical protein
MLIVVNDNGKVVKMLDHSESCRKCFITYSLESNSTSQMNKHDCEMSSSSSLSTSCQSTVQSLKQSKSDSFTSNSPQSVKLKQIEKNKIK